jgi:uncharacterized phage protein (TIGR02218 family)
MAAFVEKPLTTAALCWRLIRRDGIAIGFTTHDRDLYVAGLAYRAAPGMLPSAISLSDGFDLDTVDIKGALSSNAITAADLRAGRWDGAQVSVFMADWEQPDGETLAIARGLLGEVAMAGHGFEAELRGPTAELDAAVVEQTSPDCRASLGDLRCRIDMVGRTLLTRIAAVTAEETIVVAEAAPGNAYGYGLLRWINGANSGLDSPILRSDGITLTLREPPAYPAGIGDLIEIREGCDRMFATCSERFGNAVNFRGEPHLPGIDLLTRYPGA